MLHHIGLWGKGDTHLKKTPPQKKQTHTYALFNRLVPDTTPFPVEESQRKESGELCPALLMGQSSIEQR